MLEQCGVVILAGGLSRRMGHDKWMLTIGERTVLERIVGAFYESAAEIRIVTAAPEEHAIMTAISPADDRTCVDHSARTPSLPDLSRFPRIQYMQDAVSGIGPLGGLSAALARTSCEWNLVTGCDMPFPSLALARELLYACKRDGAMAAIPESDGRLHPLFAVYRRRCADSLQAYIARGGRKVMDWVGSLSPAIVPEKRVAELDPHGIALFNMNRPDDYEAALRLANARQQTDL